MMCGTHCTVRTKKPHRVRLHLTSSYSVNSCFYLMGNSKPIVIIATHTLTLVMEAMWVPTVSFGSASGRTVFPHADPNPWGFTLFSTPVLLRRERRRVRECDVEWCGGHLAATPPRKAISKLVVSWSFFLITLWTFQGWAVANHWSWSPPVWNPADPVSLCPSRLSALTDTTYRQVCSWIHRWQEEEGSSEAEALPSCSPCSPFITYSTKRLCKRIL